MRKFFIVVPSPHPTGPVKGAVALANALADSREVTFVTLKPGPGADAPLDPRVHAISLAHVTGWRGRIRAYRGLLAAAGTRAEVASVSMCFSADVVNSFCSDLAVTCASVRANNVKNYLMDYGPPGLGLAVCHLVGLRRFDHVVVMSRPMARQVRRYSGVHPVIIGNFVDEAVLDPHRKPAPAAEPTRIACVASLSRRKQPHVLLDAVQELLRQGEDVHLSMIGTGPLSREVAGAVQRLGLQGVVTLSGQLSNPYPAMAHAHAVVLPSLSEGMPRVALEALYLGVPCVLRDTDGNAELITSGVNGVLFRNDSELPAAILRGVELTRAGAGPRPQLLPPALRQEVAANAYRELLDHAA